MKKLIAVSILLALLSTAAFAQFKVGFTLDALTDFVHTKSYLDNFNDADEAFLGPGATDILTNRSYWDDNEMRLNLTYSNDNIKALLQINGDGLVGNKADRTFFKGTARLDDIWSAAFAEYGITGTAGKISAYIGNEHKRGATVNYRYFQNDFVKNSMANFGLFIPNEDFYGAVQSVMSGTIDSDVQSALTGSFFTTYEGNNFARLTRAAGGQNPHLDVNFNFAPFTVSLAGALGSPNTNNFNDQLLDTAADEAESKIGLMARVSGDKVADKINFDVTYMVYGGDSTLKTDPFYNAGSLDYGYSEEVDGAGYWQHSVGVYAGLSIIQNLGIAVGYTGRFRVQEDYKDGNDDIREEWHPLYNGIDLRFRFTGVDKLTITFNNNFSFARVQGSDSKDMVSMFGGPMVTKDHRESWFGMFNVLAAAFKATDALTIEFNASNRAGWLEYKTDNNDKYRTTMDHLNLALFASYNFNPNVQLESGLMMDIQHFTYDDDDDKYKAGTLRFGIPVRFKVQW